MRNLKQLALCLILMNCTRNQAIITPDPVSIDGTKFLFMLYDNLPRGIIEPIQGELDQCYSRILSDLEVDSMKKVTVKIWGDTDNFYEDMKETTGTVYYGATGWIFGLQEVRILYTGEYTFQTVLHEFCHAVSLAVNGTICNNPRWLWEAVALYESGEFRDPKTINYLVSGDFPSIEELNSEYNTGQNKIYAVGYLLSEYIVSTWGRNTYVDLIRSNGDIQTTLALPVNLFEEGFMEFITEKYLTQ